jgi:hypothetical protein
MARRMLLDRHMRHLASVAALVVLAGPALADSTTTTVAIQGKAARVGVARGFAAAGRTVGDLRVEVLESDPGADAPQLHVGLSDGHTYWTSTQTLDAVHRDCGAGRCVTTAITRESIDQTDGVVWIRFELVSEIDHNDPEASEHDFTTHETAVMGCSLPHDKIAPRCAWYEPGVLQSSHVDIAGTTLTVTTTTGTVQTVELALS